MPILVTCTGCKAQFNVSEKFAGKQGPCPKCKALITIPKAAATATAAPPPAEVKIHAPDDAPQPGKTTTGQASLKPLVRNDARLTPRLLATVVVTAVVLFVAAWLGGRYVHAPPPLSPAEESQPDAVSARRMQMLPIYGLRALGLLLIGWPVVVAGYAVLRDDELEPYRGRSLWRRVLICLAVYIGIWGAYALIPADIASEPLMLGAMIPMLLLPAAAAAYFCFDLDYLGSLIHACFFFLVTLLLGATAGLTMPWTTGAAEIPIGPLAPDVQIEVQYQ